MVDADGELIAPERQDAVIGIRPYIAIGKARDAAKSKSLLRHVPRNDQLVTSNISLPEGAIPVIAGNQIIGAIGVNGAQGSNDSQVAKVAVAAIEHKSTA